MSDDWKVGDLALCVDAGRMDDREARGIEEGRTYRVRGVGVDRKQRLGLWLVGFEGDNYSAGFRAARFRKARPDSHSGELHDWELLLNSVKRRVDA